MTCDTVSDRLPEGTPGPVTISGDLIPPSAMVPFMRRKGALHVTAHSKPIPLRDPFLPMFSSRLSEFRATQSSSVFG